MYSIHVHILVQSLPQFYLFYFLYRHIFWPQLETCRILVPQAGIKPAPPAVEAQNPNYWTARKFPTQSILEHQHKRYPPPLKVIIHLPPPPQALPPQAPAFSPRQTLVCFPCIYLFWTFHVNGFIPIWSSVTGFFHLA